ncbi:MAG: ketopantoate reductase family protein [Ignavibacteriae bacterium]|nr:ketopantoate reductase family protein [Ignavibacteriota bacterium]NOG98347.1 ketopantoate reductase family protein [Ignavibacteriota bacterium]
MKTLIIGAGPLGSLYTYLFHKAGHDVSLLARNEHYTYLEENGLTLINEFTNEKINAGVKITNKLDKEDEYDLVIVLVRKNSLEKIIPLLANAANVKHILFMGNNALGYKEYLEVIPSHKILFGFPGGGGSRIDHVVHYIDSEKPGGKRIPVVIGEIDGKVRERTTQIVELFESAEIPVKIIDDMDGWLKYHAIFVQPLACALIEAGDNYKLSKNPAVIRKYIRSVKEGIKILKALGYKKSYNPKLDLIRIMPEGLTIKILQKVFDSKFSEVAMMMHVNAAKDEMIELGDEILHFRERAGVDTPYLNSLINSIKVNLVNKMKKVLAAGAAEYLG